jgi:hypothetical protein
MTLVHGGGHRTILRVGVGEQQYQRVRAGFRPAFGKLGVIDSKFKIVSKPF